MEAVRLDSGVVDSLLVTTAGGRCCFMVEVMETDALWMHAVEVVRCWGWVFVGKMAEMLILRFGFGVMREAVTGSFLRRFRSQFGEKETRVSIYGRSGHVGGLRAGFNAWMGSDRLAF
ncbi:Uncharacterized protein Rs2_39285 [Raphanus sativus]|nr:Uncharacterized protein Rs2_39285 [Raphanus sativus]